MEEPDLLHEDEDDEDGICLVTLESYSKTRNQSVIGNL